MPFDEDAWKNWDQLLDEIWSSLSAKLQAEYQRHMAATGRTWSEICSDAHERFLTHYAETQQNPTTPFARALCFRRFPYGQDPRLPRWQP